MFTRIRPGLASASRKPADDLGLLLLREIHTTATCAQEAQVAARRVMPRMNPYEHLRTRGLQQKPMPVPPPTPYPSEEKPSQTPSDPFIHRYRMRDVQQQQQQQIQPQQSQNSSQSSTQQGRSFMPQSKMQTSPQRTKQEDDFYAMVMTQAANQTQNPSNTQPRRRNVLAEQTPTAQDTINAVPSGNVPPSVRAQQRRDQSQQNTRSAPQAPMTLAEIRALASSQGAVAAATAQAQSQARQGNHTTLPSGLRITRVDAGSTSGNSRYAAKQGVNVYRGNAMTPRDPTATGGRPLLRRSAGAARGSQGPRGPRMAGAGQRKKAAGAGGEKDSTRPPYVKREKGDSKVPLDRIKYDTPPDMHVAEYTPRTTLEVSDLTLVAPGTIITDMGRDYLLAREIAQISPEETVEWTARQWTEYEKRREEEAKKLWAGDRSVVAGVRKEDPGRMGEAYRLLMRNDSYDEGSESAVMRELRKRMPSVSLGPSGGDAGRAGRQSARA